MLLRPFVVYVTREYVIQLGFFCDTTVWPLLPLFYALPSGNSFTCSAITNRMHLTVRASTVAFAIGLPLILCLCCFRYGIVANQSPIARTVVDYGMFLKNLRVEIYKMELKMCLHPNIDELKTSRFSKVATLEEVEKVRI